MSTTPETRAILRQLLETDRLLGLKSWPIAPNLARPVPATPAATSPRQAAAARGKAARPAARATGTPRPPGKQRPAATPSASGAGNEEKAQRLRVLDEEQVKGCQKCGLHETRNNTVFGQGSPSARLVFVGEAPGFDEDRQGLAFVGRAGQLLTKMIQAMGVTRDEAFICNVLKCRPPDNRDPAADEILACSPYLKEQLRIIEPEVLVALGAPAAKTLLSTSQSIGRLRGRFHEYVLTEDPFNPVTVPLMPTYHPAYLLRNPAEKAKTWADLQMVMALLGLSRPGT